MVTEKDIEQFSLQCKNIFEQIGRDVIGQKEVVEGTVIAMIAGGNVLLEGVPGVGKTRFGAFARACIFAPFLAVFSLRPI